MTDIAPSGLHHVTAIASDPQRNVDFYTQVLGLRLVKQTVNFDAHDPPRDPTWTRRGQIVVSACSAASTRR